MPGEVTFDNEEHEQFTIMKVEVKDYPGLLRVIAWVLNGLQLVVQNARCCAYLPLGSLCCLADVTTHSSVFCAQAHHRQDWHCKKPVLDHN